MDWKKLTNPEKDLDLLKSARSVFEDACGDDPGTVALSAEIADLERFIHTRNRKPRKLSHEEYRTLVDASQILERQRWVGCEALRQVMKREGRKAGIVRKAGEKDG